MVRFVLSASAVGSLDLSCYTLYLLVFYSYVFLVYCLLVSLGVCPRGVLFKLEVACSSVLIRPFGEAVVPSGIRMLLDLGTTRIRGECQ